MAERHTLEHDLEKNRMRWICPHDHASCSLERMDQHVADLHAECWGCSLDVRLVRLLLDDIVKREGS